MRLASGDFFYKIMQVLLHFSSFTLTRLTCDLKKKYIHSIAGHVSHRTIFFYRDIKLCFLCPALRFDYMANPNDGHLYRSEYAICRGICYFLCNHNTNHFLSHSLMAIQSFNTASRLLFHIKLHLT